MSWPTDIEPRIRLTLRQLEPPVARAIVVFSLTMAALIALAVAGIWGSIQLPLAASSHFGVMAVTTFAIAGGLAAYRAATTRNGWAAAIAAVLFGPGAAWSWAAFVADGEPPVLATAATSIVASALAIALVVAGLRTAHWLEVFGGLGLLGLGFVAALVDQDPATTTTTAIPALLASVSGMICVYGLLIDLELSEHRSLVELEESRQRIEEEVGRVEELLHDLRSGLLAIEAAIGSFDDELAGPLQTEAARLRRLTLTGDRSVDSFDLCSGVAAMVSSRRRSGADLVLRAPKPVRAWGEESEVLSIVDNLLANAERHGCDGPIEVDLTQVEGTTRLTVSNPGELPTVDPEILFRRGMTTHPDGQGLGLARARMLAGINGGDLRVGPAPTGWTSFVLSLQTEPTGQTPTTSTKRTTPIPTTTAVA